MATQHYDHQNQGQNSQTQAQVVVVVVPFPAQGHINQLLHLTRLISSYNIPVYYVGTATHNRQAKFRLHGWDPLSIPNVHFHEFPDPSFASPPPNPNAPIKFPSHLQPLFDVLSHLRNPISKFLFSISPTARRIIVIHDSLMSLPVQDVVSIPNAESYGFQSSSAFFIFWYIWEAMGRPFIIEHEIPKNLPSLEGCFTPEMVNFMNTQTVHEKVSCGDLYDTCKVVESQYIDLLAKKEFCGNKKQWAIGPFNPVSICNDRRSTRRHKCLEWLDKQAQNSVIYVSFGTTTSLDDEQIQELAIGLEQSEQKFIWVLRDADKVDIFKGEVRRAELPKGFEERVDGKGMVVRDWAPQMEILGHPSTGGFMTHCGWNSCMESITMGVPIAAWPMHSDQPLNAMLITDVLKIGTIVRDWASRDELVTSTAVEKIVRKLMASIGGDVMRKRAVEMGSAVRRSVEEGGVTRMELDSFIAHITR